MVVSSVNTAQSYVELTGDGVSRYVCVFVTAAETSKLGSLTRGQRITIVGTGDGQTSNNVYIRNSVIQ
ncbi:hypothetical protein FACS1894151_07910 [Spirochaetia bacterium]|nr:hypothetical protein FACS1894151_07910 [Spirochaetia bacterium]